MPLTMLVLKNRSASISRWIYRAKIGFVAQNGAGHFDIAKQTLDCKWGFFPSLMRYTTYDTKFCSISSGGSLICYIQYSCFYVKKTIKHPLKVPVFCFLRVSSDLLKLSADFTLHFWLGILRSSDMRVFPGTRQFRNGFDSHMNFELHFPPLLRSLFEFLRFNLSTLHCLHFFVIQLFVSSLLKFFEHFCFSHIIAANWNWSELNPSLCGGL